MLISFLYCFYILVLVSYTLIVCGVLCVGLCVWTSLSEIKFTYVCMYYIVWQGIITQTQYTLYVQVTLGPLVRPVSEVLTVQWVTQVQLVLPFCKFRQPNDELPEKLGVQVTCSMTTQVIYR